MKKTVWALVLGAGLLGACGGVTSEDIERAAKDLDREEAASGLNLAIGQFWVSLETSKSTSEYGTVSKDGVFNGIAANTNVSETKETAVDKVMGTTYVESVDKNGFVIERVARETGAQFTNGSTTTQGNLSTIDRRAGYVMFELDNWVRMIFPSSPGADYDLNPGTAVNPLAPRIDAVYTTDQGESWKGETVEAVAGVNAVKINRLFPAYPYKLADFYKTCFAETAGTVVGSRNVNVKAECVGTWINNGGSARFVIEESESRWVARKVSFKSVSKEVVIELDTLVCENGAATPPEGSFMGGLADCVGNASITMKNNGGPEKRTREDIDEVTKFGASADKKALPNIDTDAQ